MNNVLVSVHGYAGDAHQVNAFMPLYLHHGQEVIIVSPEDSPIHMSPITYYGPEGIPQELLAGKRAYIGQDSWDRQHLQLKALIPVMEKLNKEWILMNDSDSFVLVPDLPPNIFKDQDAVWSNQCDDFRKPGGTWEDASFPNDYHFGYPLIAMQPPYFCSLNALRRLVAASENLVACPITPFIDWWFVVATINAGLTNRPFPDGASCETITINGKKAMAERIRQGATFLHSFKTKESMDWAIKVRKERRG